MLRAQLIQLPWPKLKSNISVEEAIYKRRSHRAYKKTPLTIEEISQLLFAAQGITDRQQDLRTVPSAGRLYPVEIYLVSGKIKGILPGVYKYQFQTHQLIRTLKERKRKKLSEAAFFQFWIKEAPATIILCGVFKRTTEKYKGRGKRFVLMEIGHAAQNISLQAVSLNLGTVCVGGFEDKEVKEVLRLKKEEKPLYLMPIGKIFKNCSRKEAEILEKYHQFLNGKSF